MLRKKAGKFLALALTLTLALGLVPAQAAGPEKADSVYRNANIYTVDESFSTASAIAVKGDRIVYVGDEAGVDAYIGPATAVTDLHGLTMLPGLMEGHMHFFDEGIGKTLIDGFWKPKQVILDKVKAKAETSAPGEWILGNGWMNAVWEDDSFPTKEELDAVAPNNPVLLNRADGHMIWVNSMAFELAGITKDTPNPQGGEFFKNEDGTLQGCVTDTARIPIQDAVPDWSPEQERQGILSAQQELFSYGFTSALDAGTSIHMIDNYKALYESGELKFRLYPLVAIRATDSTEAEYVKSTAPTGMLYDNRLHVAGVKILSDGSLGSRSAAMLEEYSDQAGHTGNYRFTDEQMYDLMKMSYDAGYQICTHAIGDGGNHQTIDTYERIMKENPREDPRLRIEHFQIVTPEDIDRALELGIIPAMQFTHATSDLLVAEDRVGAERLKGAYAWRTVLDKGSIIVGGSDADVELVNPYHGLYAGVTRRNRSGLPEGGWYPDQKVTREEALRAFTIWAAYGQFEEEIKGSLEVGKLADFCVIDRDYMTCPEDDIKDIQCLMTVCGGEVVYTKDTSVPTIMWKGVPVDFNTAPVVEPGVIYVPVQDLANAISAEAEVKDGKAGLTLDGKTASVAVKNVGGVDYAPVRSLFEGIGYSVTWCQNSMTASTYLTPAG